MDGIYCLAMPRDDGRWARRVAWGVDPWHQLATECWVEAARRSCRCRKREEQRIYFLFFFFFFSSSASAARLARMPTMRASPRARRTAA